MKKLIPVILLCLACTGCGLSTAAKLMKSYRISLQAYQDAEIAAFQKGFISMPQHVTDEKHIEQLADYGVQADTYIINTDKADLITAVGNGLTTVENIEANDVTAIGDATAKSAASVAAAAIQNLLAQVEIQLGVK
jgi:hypothetical protein